MKDMLSVVGVLLWVLGGAWLIYGLAAPTGPAYSDSVNLGFMTAKIAHLIAGAATFVVGAVFMAGATVAIAVEKAAAPPAEPVGARTND